MTKRRRVPVATVPTIEHFLAKISSNPGFVTGAVEDDTFVVSWREGYKIPPLASHVDIAFSVMPVAVRTWHPAALGETAPTPVSLLAALGAGSLILVLGVGFFMAASD